MMQIPCFFGAFFCFAVYFLQRYCKASGEQNEKMKDSHFLSRAAAYFLKRYCKASGEQRRSDSFFGSLSPKQNVAGYGSEKTITGKIEIISVKNFFTPVIVFPVTGILNILSFILATFAWLAWIGILKGRSTVNLGRKVMDLIWTMLQLVRMSTLKGRSMVNLGRRNAVTTPQVNLTTSLHPVVAQQLPAIVLIMYGL